MGSHRFGSVDVVNLPVWSSYPPCQVSSLIKLSVVNFPSGQNISVWLKFPLFKLSVWSNYLAKLSLWSSYTSGQIIRLVKSPSGQVIHLVILIRLVKLTSLSANNIARDGTLRLAIPKILPSVYFPSGYVGWMHPVCDQGGPQQDRPQIIQPASCFVVLLKAVIIRIRGVNPS